MNLKFFILFILLIGFVFTLLPDGGSEAPKYDFFLFTAKKVSVIVLVYHLFEHIAWIMVAYAMMIEIPKHRPFLTAFMLVKIGDVIDYLLVYNREWFSIGPVPVTFNMVSLGFLIVVFLNESGWIRKLR